MTYGYQIENWHAFEAELTKRGIAVDDIEKVELASGSAPTGSFVRVTLRSGHSEAWHHRERDAAPAEPA